MSPRPRRSVASRRSWSSSAERRPRGSPDEGQRASLIVGNNVLAQVPDLNDFVGGVKILLRDNGTATFEFPHLLRLLDEVQYDTIYHEHFSYFSLATIAEILSRARTRRSTTSEELSDARRLAARVRPARGRSAPDQRTPSRPCCSRARRQRGFARPSATSGSRRTSRSPSAPCSSS